MKNISIKIEECLWCKQPYEKERTIAYCSEPCRQQMTRQRLNERRLTDYHIIPVEAVHTEYNDYQDNSLVLIEKYSTVVPKNDHPPKHDPIPIPTISFKRFPETRNILILTLRREEDRANWHE